MRVTALRALAVLAFFAAIHPPVAVSVSAAPAVMLLMLARLVLAMLGMPLPMLLVLALPVLLALTMPRLLMLAMVLRLSGRSGLGGGGGGNRKRDRGNDDPHVESPWNSSGFEIVRRIAAAADRQRG